MIVDLAIVAFVGTFVRRGLKRGLLLSLTGFVGFFAAAAAAVFGFPLVAEILADVAKLSGGVANLAAALTIFVAVTAGFTIAGRALTKLVGLTKWRIVNAAGGGALSGAWAMSWTTMVLLALNVVPVSKGVEAQMESSALAGAIVEQAPGWLGRVARTDMRDMLALFQPSQRKVSIKATTDFDRSTGAERRLFELINEERRARGLKALRWDERLARAARAHAADMYRRGYFGHTSPDGRTPADRLDRFDVSYTVNGENLALAPGARIAHNQLMGSARHREQILHRRYTRIGIAAMFGRQGLVVTEEFAG